MKNKNDGSIKIGAASMTNTEAAPVVKLRRVLSLSDLIIYGIILIQPVAALPLFGHAFNGNFYCS